MIISQPPERKPQPQKANQIITWITALYNSVKLEPCYAGPPKMDRSWWRVLKNMVYWRQEWQITSGFLP